MTKDLLISTLSFALILCASMSIQAQAQDCSAQDRACILKEIEQTSKQIEKTSWRDQTYRELSKTKAFEGDMDGAIALIGKIETPDTQAMTIRGIGMAAADLKLAKDDYEALFSKLRAQTETITHRPSYAIALTYIAMAQAFAGDNDAAWKTANDMKNDALRHKAFGETAEIQAENGDVDAALKSIGFIDSAAFRNKAYTLVSKILAGRKEFDGAMQAAMKIENAYKKAGALQYILDQQKPRDVKK